MALRRHLHQAHPQQRRAPEVERRAALLGVQRLEGGRQVGLRPPVESCSGDGT
jgi:hypothetical protein